MDITCLLHQAECGYIRLYNNVISYVMCWNISDFSQNGGLCWPYTSNVTNNLLNMPFVNENSYSISEVKHFYSFVGKYHCYCWSVFVAFTYNWMFGDLSRESTSLLNNTAFNICIRIYYRACEGFTLCEKLGPSS
jgi:hypothetical protein